MSPYLTAYINETLRVVQFQKGNNKKTSKYTERQNRFIDSIAGKDELVKINGSANDEKLCPKV